MLFLAASALLLLVASANNDGEIPNCSLKGDKNEHSTCMCDKPWTGPDCCTLDIIPVSSFPQGCDVPPNKTTWGGDLLVTKENYKDKYLLFCVRHHRRMFLMKLPYPFSHRSCCCRYHNWSLQVSWTLHYLPIPTIPRSLL